MTRAQRSRGRASSTTVGAIAASVGTLAVLALGSARYARRIERLVPADGEFVTVDGVRLHYRDEGQGPAIVLIHGLGGQMRNFSYALLARLAGSRVVLVDRPGSGYSDAAPSADIQTQARLIAGVIDALELDRPLIVGHSLGGAVALALALDHPNHVGGLALVCPLTQPGSKPPKAFEALAIASPALRAVAAHTIAVPGSILGKARQAELVFAPEPVPRDFGVRGGGDLLFRPAAFAGASADYVAIEQVLAGLVSRYPTLTVPVSILFGREDAILDPQLHGAEFASDVSASVFDLIDGGHMIPVTRPNAVADWIVRQHAAIQGN